MIRTLHVGWRAITIAFILVSAFITASGDHDAAAAGTSISPEALEAACRKRGGYYSEIWHDGLLVGYRCTWDDGNKEVYCDYAGYCQYFDLTAPTRAPEDEYDTQAPVETAPEYDTQAPADSGTYDRAATVSTGGVQYGGSAYEYDPDER